MTGHRIDNRANAASYVFGGKAKVTVVGRASRFTFRVTKAKEGSKWEGCIFIEVLSGPDNENDFQRLGMIRSKGGFVPVKGGVSADATSFKAFKWLVEHGLQSNEAFAQCEVWHHGKCSACGRSLTDPASIERGLGPICAERAAF